MFQVSKLKQVKTLEKLNRAGEDWAHFARLYEAGKDAKRAQVAANIAFLCHMRIERLLRPILIPDTAAHLAPHLYRNPPEIHTSITGLRGWRTAYPDLKLR